MDVPTPSSFLILHGYENHRPPGHWQRYLAEELTVRGHDVRYPQLPDPDAPDEAAWLEVALANLATLTEGPVTVVAHSASAVMWLRACSRADAEGIEVPRVARVAVVSPPEADVMLAIPAVAAFAWRPTGEPLDLRADEALVVIGGGDEFAPHGAAGIAPHVAAPVVEVPGAGHITPSSGYGEWPAMLDWCLGLPAFHPSHSPG
ncbi:hypothetical protein EDF46_1095 [Frondihabitans sp. PhB188]|uniref:RBBP9/YdeN family alpha/beta hydrolase n=1 Tax=Frondihabitans sp. PhB188 TaxID=2485200 RepID=UPI000F4716D6|nr:alpha/beta hydrolase [Frondihabitans sp. PhB188]ROQ39463.1 hypothetical protein EDF46_1095 [Frondihabitans sp. PhB188]